MAFPGDTLVRSGIHEGSSLISTCSNQNAEDGCASDPREVLETDGMETDPESIVEKDKQDASSTSRLCSGNTRRSHSPAGRKGSRPQDLLTKSCQPSGSTQPARAEKASNELDFSILLGIAVALAVVAMGAVTLVSRSMKGSKPPVNHSYRVDIFREHLRKLKHVYVGQPEHNWQIIFSSAVEVLNASEAQHGPAVLLILAPSHNENLARMIGNDVALALSDAFEDGGAYGEIEFEILGFTEDTIAAKHIVDKRCKSTFVEKKQHVILVPHIESWNPELAMMLHPLCDYENPLYRDTAIILTAFTKESIGETGRLRYDRVAEQVLNDAWDDMDTNQRHAIISRVTVNVIILQDEHKVFSGVQKQ